MEINSSKKELFKAVNSTPIEEQTEMAAHKRAKADEADKIQEGAFVKQTYTSNLRDMINRVDSEPKAKMIYSGIKENSVGFIFGPPKCGKTLSCENLAMSIAAGENSYLDIPIQIENRKTLFISMEEFYKGRTERNKLQVSKLIEKHGDQWLDNYIVVNENIPRYLVTGEEWNIIKNIIVKENPGIVFFDSLSRMHSGSIEESKVAKELMKNLRELTNELKVTVVVIHHTYKLTNEPLTISTLAGSRIISQDADFMIGLNRTTDGKRYIKEVAFRYAPENATTVRTFEIGDDCWLKLTGEVEEFKLLSVYDGRVDDGNRERLFEFIAERNGEPVSFSEIEKMFIATKIMSKPTAYAQLNHLEREGRIVKPEKGIYKMAA
jgi:KaiC/GvpD/RAD55 family RecA-like ATPase